eukprot:9495827-Pyramimonas_sp.AAC.1
MAQRVKKNNLALSQDPTLHTAVAPVVRYSEDIWANQTRLLPFVMTWGCFSRRGPKLLSVLGQKRGEECAVPAVP